MKLPIFITALFLSVFSFSASAQNARVQFIHNSPDTSLKYVDIYWNGILLYNNFVFHRASPFINCTGGAAGIISIADSSSTSVTDAFASFDFTPAPSQVYILILQGIKEQSGYASYQPFDIKIISNAREFGLDYATVDMLFVGGSPDADTVDINETLLVQVPFAQNLSYGNYTSYISMFTGNYIFRIVDSSDQMELGDFNAPFSEYGLNGKAVTILTSGFSNPVENSNGQLLSMWMARAGGGMMTEFISSSTSLRMIHNSPDVSLPSVDVYWNNKKIIDDLPFRNSTAVVTRRLPGSTVNIGFAAGGSASSDEIIYTHTYQPNPSDTTLFVLNGLHESNGYASFQPLSLSALPNSLPLPSSEGEVKISFMNTLTDLPSFRMTNSDEETLVVNASYGVSNVYSVPAQQQNWRIKNTASTYEIAAFDVPFENEGGQSHLVLASGFYHPEQNNDGAAYGLWMDINESGPLVELHKRDDSFSQVRFFNNSADALAAEVDVYVNDELLIDSLSFASTNYVDIKADADIEIKIVPAGQAITAAIFHSTYHLDTASNYLMWLDGIPSSTGYNPNPPYTIHVLENPESTSTNNSQADMIFFNGSTDTGQLTFSAPAVPWLPVQPSLPYGNFSGDYFSVDAGANQIMRVASSVGGFIFGHYVVPFSSSELAGEAVIIFTHGFWNPSNNSNGSAFSVWMMHPDGTIQQLEAFDFVGLDTDTAIENLLLYPNPSNEFITVIANGKAINDGRSYIITDINGRNIADGKMTGTVDISLLPSGIYCLQIGGYSVRFSKQ